MRTEQATLELDACTSRIMHLRLVFPNKIATGQQVALPSVDPDLTLSVEDSDPYTVKTADFTLQIYRDALRLVFRDIAGSVVVQMDARALGWESTDDGRRRPQARFRRATEEHYYGLGQGDPAWTRTAPPGDCGTATTATGPGPTWPSRSF